MGHGEHDSASLVANVEEGHAEGPTATGPAVPTENELQEVGNLQAELASMQARMWNSDDITDEEAEELERKQTLLKIKLTQASDSIKEWGMTTGLERMIEFENMHKKWHDAKPVDEQKVLFGLLPVAFVFMCLVFGASYIHFQDATLIPGELYAVDAAAPIVWPLAGASYMIEARIQIPSTAGPGEAAHVGHRRAGQAGKMQKTRRNKLGGGGGLLRRAGQALADAIEDRKASAKEHLVAKQQFIAAASAPPAGPPSFAVAAPRQHGVVAAPRQHKEPNVGHAPTPGKAHGTPAPSGGHGAGKGAAGHGTPVLTRPVDPTPHPAYLDPVELGPLPGAGHDGIHDYISVYLMELKDQACVEAEDQSWAALEACSETITQVGDYKIREEEQSKLLELQLSENPLNTVLVVTTDAIDPMPIAIQLHSLGWTGPYQVGIAALIMCFVFSLITTEAMHRTMAAMIGAAMTLVVLGLQNRVPSLSTVVGWMDHGTLGLLWGMMLIVGITMRTGVFEWTGVLACKLSGGDKTKLLLLLCLVTAVLSAFLDNVTTILLIAPVTCKLCKLVGIDPCPYLISEAIFSNVGGTATMIGDPPNIIIGNMLAKYLDFNSFLFNLAPGVLFVSPFVFRYLTWYYGDAVKGQLTVDIVKLQKMYPITNRALLIKCGVVLSCVIASFFLHPVTHLDPAWVAIMGAVWLLVAFDMHHCHEALLGVEWDTLLFFAALFVVVEGVGELGLLRFIANTLSGMVGAADLASRQIFAIVLIVWSSAIFSAFVDNIPFTATMVPIMLQLVEQVPGISIEPLAWALAFGACFGGNGTLIGASANIVMASKAEVEGAHISFIDFFKVGFPVMLLSVFGAMLYLIVLNTLFWQATAGM
mmetsp:Transcript_27974/g.54629  ORF Transcript_27974/g.54629 Transcript_27974/m.54629 type:complete len:872 (-) Transcript_27974:555-3170(-)|eukprot:CAMPEP_0173378486 /NCGR_PEP_ID=MMETSP1356-20130122/1633_1 /TAXON_ID=77927 ORGANISM="Hemiselmis virescens, Strain PCC157" /NCGR_SAMPLE_ID=MMETSP1356 /ASSEMBLY_ACC=CAM_ASM_000847 /LENGTH=871 /DNA_ID=CAMNT_0014331565 /DNA_START=81 /DNA_END=2696 /DNA_ORIENTATION=-